MGVSEGGRWPVSLWRPFRTDPRSWFTDEQIQRAKRYKAPLIRSALASNLTSLAVLVLLIATGTSDAVIDALGLTSWPTQAFAATVTVLLVIEIATLPFAIWKEFVHERRHGFSTTTPARFAADQVKTIVLNDLMVFPLLIVPVWGAVRATELWWLFGAGLLLLLSVGLAALYPTVILPRFNTLTPLEDAELRERLRALARAGDAAVSEFLVMDASSRTRKGNAFFAGMGPTRRVVLFDTILELGHDEVVSVVAHELGHWKLAHQRRAIVAGLVTVPLLFAGAAALVSWQPALRFAEVNEVADPRTIPLFVLALGLTVSLTTLIQAWFSRQAERAADLYGLELNRDVDAFRSAFLRIAERDLPDLAPGWWGRISGAHPPIAERLAFAEAWREHARKARS